MSEQQRSVRISGGTFFLCLWLVWIVWELSWIAHYLQLIAERMAK